MHVTIKLDIGSLALGAIIGLLMAPYVYDSKKMKHVAKVGAVKEVAVETKKSVKGIFNRKDKE